MCTPLEKLHESLTTRAVRKSADGSLHDCGLRQDSATTDALLPRGSEHFLTSRQDVVQRVLKMRCGLGELPSDLQDILFVALLNLVLEELL